MLFGLQCFAHNDFETRRKRILAVSSGIKGMIFYLEDSTMILLSFDIRDSTYPLDDEYGNLAS